MALAVLLLILTVAALPAGVAAEPVTVTVERGTPGGASFLALGITHTQTSLEWSQFPEAVARAKALLKGTVRLQNQHIMGWGGGSPEPSPGVMDFSSLDYRVGLMRSLGGEMVLTFCAAPDWMKGGEVGKTDWSKIEVAPTREHYADFARLAATIAARYPDVRYFQVWNEMKGFWNRQANNWDYEAYTDLYNQVYDAVKAVRPDARVGGLYMVIEGSGSGRGGWYTEPPIRARQLEVIDYWLAHKHGADFICLDRGVKGSHDPNRYSQDELMGMTHWFEDIARQVRARTDLPIWWSEYYGFGDAGSQYLAAQYASILVHMIRGGSAVALLWNPVEGEIGHYLFTSTRTADGARPTPHYTVYRWVSEHFGPGTALVRATSSSEWVEVLASPSHTLLVNKRGEPVEVRLNGAGLTLAAYEVRLVATP